MYVIELIHTDGDETDAEVETLGTLGEAEERAAQYAANGERYYLKKVVFPPTWENRTKRVALAILNAEPYVWEEFVRVGRSWVEYDPFAPIPWVGDPDEDVAPQVDRITIHLT